VLTVSSGSPKPGFPQDLGLSNRGVSQERVPAVRQGMQIWSFAEFPPCTQ